jgi:signal transduction histidine kinase
MSRSNPTPRQLKVLSIPSAIANHDRRNHDRRTAAEPADDLVLLGSHELRNAVSSIVGCAELVDSGDLADDALHLYTGILLREGRRLSALVNRAVELQRLEHGHRDLDLAPVDLRSLIQRAVVTAGEDDLRPIEIDVPSELPLVSAEAEAILEVLGNFISNARRFSPEGGSIGIAARQLGDMVEVDIRDHGIGIDAQALPKLFRKFYRPSTTGSSKPMAASSWPAREGWEGAPGSSSRCRSRDRAQPPERFSSSKMTRGSPPC